jgi:hypothetical protein
MGVSGQRHASAAELKPFPEKYLFCDLCYCSNLRQCVKTAKSRSVLGVFTVRTKHHTQSVTE